MAFPHKCSGKKTSEHIGADKTVHCNSSNRKHLAGGQKEQIHLILNSVRENVNAIYLFAKQQHTFKCGLVFVTKQRWDVYSHSDNTARV